MGGNAVGLLDCFAEPGGIVCALWQHSAHATKDLKRSVFDAFSDKFYAACFTYCCLGSVFGALGSAHASYSATSTATVLLNGLAANCERNEHLGAAEDGSGRHLLRLCKGGVLWPLCPSTGEEAAAAVPPSQRKALAARAAAISP